MDAEERKLSRTYVKGMRKEMTKQNLVEFALPVTSGYMAQRRWCFLT